MRNIKSCGLSISCGAEVNVKESYFLGAKIEVSYGGSLIIENSYFNSDTKKK